MTKKITSLRAALIIALIGSVLLLLSACGQKGPLYLPKNALTQLDVHPIASSLPN